jgi:hypothetical protein
MKWPAVAVALVLAACGDDLTYRFGELVQVTAASPLPTDCNGAAQSGVLAPSQEVEPMIAVDPTDGTHFVAAWQQDRWSNGASDGLVAGASFDGGLTWTTTIPHFSRCTGGNDANGGGYERATDPWVSFGPDGAVYLLGLSLDGTTARNALLAVRSSDGGRTWSEPDVVHADDDSDVFNDKDSITADPTMPSRAYATWDRLTGQTMPSKPIGTGPAMLSIFHDGAWDPAVPIYDPGKDAQTIGNVIAVTSDGTLVDVFDNITMASTQTPVSTIAVIRSTDHGATWSAPITLGTDVQVGVQDPQTGVYVRSGGLPAIAADPHSGAVYVVSEQQFGQIDGVALWMSTDGGVSWTPTPSQVTAPTIPAFTPMVAVADDGAVAISYYDTRDDDPHAGGFDIAAFLATSRDRGATWTEERLTGPFDLRPSMVGQVYFLGDYQGLAASGSTIVPFFAAAMTDDDPTDMFVRPL